jgi:hypothetical protein
VRKARGIASLEAVKDETSFVNMPDLEQPPVIESRPVGNWEVVEGQVIEVSEYSKQAMAEWAEYTHPLKPISTGDPIQRLTGERT